MRRRRFNRNFPKNLNLTCFVLSLSPRNGNNPWEFSKCRHFALIVLLWNSCRFHSFVRIHFSQVKSMRTHFCRCVLAEREKLDFSVVFSKAGFLPMDNEIVLMKANKGRIYYLFQDFFSLFKTTRIENQSKLRALRNYCPRGSSFIPCQNFSHEFGIFRKKTS